MKFEIEMSLEEHNEIFDAIRFAQNFKNNVVNLQYKTDGLIAVIDTNALKELVLMDPLVTGVEIV